MRYNKLGNSDVSVSEISLGCWTLGGPNWDKGNPIGWADVNEDEVIAAVKKAVDAGVNHFDNADIYGNGKAERLLSLAFDKLGLDNTQYVIATKIGHFRGTSEHPYRANHIRNQCEQSLINLKRDYIDIYYFHHGDFGDHLEEAAETMDALVKEGKVRLKGQSAYSEDDFARAVPVVKPTVLQSWANILDYRFLKPESVVSQMLADGSKSYVAFSPLGQGLLLDKFSPESPPTFEPGDNRANSQRFKVEFLEKLQPCLQKLKDRFGGTTEDLSAVAQRYILRKPGVACVIPGFRNERQVSCNLQAAERDLSDEDLAFIDETFANLS